jgi:hypothetical protein
MTKPKTLKRITRYKINDVLTWYVHHDCTIGQWLADSAEADAKERDTFHTLAGWYGVDSEIKFTNKEVIVTIWFEKDEAEDDD